MKPWLFYAVYEIRKIPFLITSSKKRSTPLPFHHMLGNNQMDMDWLRRWKSITVENLFRGQYLHVFQRDGHIFTNHIKKPYMKLTPFDSIQ